MPDTGAGTEWNSDGHYLLSAQPAKSAIHQEYINCLTHL